MASRDSSLRPKTEIENILWAIGKENSVSNIELARVIANNLQLNEERVTLFLGQKLIVIDPIFLKEREIVSAKNGFFKNLKMRFNRRYFDSSAMRRLLKLTGHELLILKK